MSDQNPPFMFWAIAIVGLLWSLIGCWNFVVQSDSDAVAQMPEVYRLIIENRPDWVTLGFAISVFGGVLGAVLLLLRRKLAMPIFVLSLLGTIVTFYFTLRVLGLEPATASALLMSFALVVFTSVSQQRGWLK